MRKVLGLIGCVLGAVGFAFGADGDDDGMAAAREALLAPAKHDTQISADRMEYNYKEAVAIMTDNVVVDDPRFRLTSDRLFVFLDGTNSLKQLVVMGHVAVSNENRRASCEKAVYTKADEQLVMVGNATLINVGEDGRERRVTGDKITIWTTDQRIEVYPRPTLVLPAGSSSGIKELMQ